MLFTSQIHVDTGKTGLDESGGTVSVFKTNGNPFQSVIKFGNRHRAFRSITLKNVQVPLCFYNIRAPYNTFVLSSGTYVVTPGKYGDIVTLGSALVTPQGSTSAVTLNSLIGTFSVNTSTNILNMAGNGNALPVQPVNSFLYFLGFQSTTPITVSGGKIFGTVPYLLNFDTYINIWIDNLGQSSQEPNQITFKIPLSPNNISSNNVMYWSEGSQNRQHIEVTDKSVRVDRMNIIVNDRFGNLLNNNGVDWSMSFDICSEN